jgi:hypothetical protein
MRKMPGMPKKASYKTVSNGEPNPQWVQLQCGRGDRIRTYDLLVPNQALYQAKLHPATPSPPHGDLTL